MSTSTTIRWSRKSRPLVVRGRHQRLDQHPLSATENSCPRHALKHFHPTMPRAGHTPQQILWLAILLVPAPGSTPPTRTPRAICGWRNAGRVCPPRRRSVAIAPIASSMPESADPLDDTEDVRPSPDNIGPGPGTILSSGHSALALRMDKRRQSLYCGTHNGGALQVVS